ncbi:hypothetical protein SRHO_G00167760 [Serrasalmus rhombeus]
MVVVVVSSGVELVQETLEPLFEVTEEEAGSEVQDGDTDESEASWWDTFAFWNWGAEDKIDEFKKKRAARQRQSGEKAGSRIRNREMSTKGLLKERD